MHQPAVHPENFTGLGVERLGWKDEAAVILPRDERKQRTWIVQGCGPVGA